MSRFSTQEIIDANVAAYKKQKRLLHYLPDRGEWDKHVRTAVGQNPLLRISKTLVQENYCKSWEGFVELCGFDYRAVLIREIKNANIAAYQEQERLLGHPSDRDEWDKHVYESKKSENPLLRLHSTLIKEQFFGSWEKFLKSCGSDCSQLLLNNSKLTKTKIASIKKANKDALRQYAKEFGRPPKDPEEWNEWIKTQNNPLLRSFSALRDHLGTWTEFLLSCGFKSKTAAERSFFTELSADQLTELKKINEAEFRSYVTFSLQTGCSANPTAWNRSVQHQKEQIPGLQTAGLLRRLFEVESWEGLFELFKLPIPEEKQRQGESRRKSRLYTDKEERPAIEVPRAPVDAEKAKCLLIEAMAEVTGRSAPNLQPKNRKLAQPKIIKLF